MKKVIFLLATVIVTAIGIYSCQVMSLSRLSTPQQVLW
jgi:hypothetical protein